MTSGIFRRIAAATIASLTVLALAAAPGSPAQAGVTSQPGDSHNPWLDTRFLHIAHQGVRARHPSNTLYAFKRAVALRRRHGGAGRAVDRRTTGWW